MKDGLKIHDSVESFRSCEARSMELKRDDFDIWDVGSTSMR